MKFKKVLSLGLAFAMAFSLCACGSKEPESTGDNGETKEENTEMSYTDQSAAIYDEVLGDFYSYYQEAKEKDNLSERYAYMAIAEAKLLETGVMLPTSTNGGTYVMTRAAYHSGDYAQWGNDEDRLHQVIATTELIKNEDWDALKTLWKDCVGTGTYQQKAKDYLTKAGYKLKDEWSRAYSSDPVTWDVLATSLQADSRAIVNTYDGLAEYDSEGTLQPALAESWEVSEDGLTYTFHLRDGLKWVDSQGRAVADLTADDFVAGMQHMLDAQGGLEYLVKGIIVNAAQYIDGEVTDINEVGVKAVDDKTVQYTLEAPTSYFMTMLGYSIFAPMSRTYYESQGGKFGSEYDSSAADYTYGTDSDHIAYCGPYLVTNATKNNTIVFEANDSYWNKDGINLKKITWLYDDGTDPTKSYNDCMKGVVSACTVTNAIIELAKSEGTFDKFAHASDTDATSFMAFINMNRAAFANTNDDTTVVSSMTDEQKEASTKALRNLHFRRALCFAIDRGSYNEQVVGADLKYVSLRNTYTPGNFVHLEEDVTLPINGEDKTFPAGTQYGEIMQAQIDADGVKMTVWDPAADDGNGSSDGYDGWYSPENAMEEMNQAMEELSDLGISKDNPIYLDVPAPLFNEVYGNRENIFKQSIEKSLGGLVIVNLVECTSMDEWYYAGYYTSTGNEANYSIYDCSGWGPDYGDPQTYLDTMLPNYNGYMVRNFGIF